MVNSNSTISPQLEQALSTVVDKRELQNALKALELSEVAREEAEMTVEQQQNYIAYLSNDRAMLLEKIKGLETANATVRGQWKAVLTMLERERNKSWELTKRLAKHEPQKLIRSDDVESLLG